MGKRTVNPGEEFGFWKVLSESPNKGKHRVLFCRCSCGKELDVFLCNLTSGKTTSCGCQNHKRTKQRMTTHGMARTRTYRIWRGIINRCGPGGIYEARGIGMCDEWKKFDSFFADMGKCPDGLTIERIDTLAGYSKENCKWATYREQAVNRRRTIMIRHEDTEMCLLDWTTLLGLHYGTVKTRIQDGVPPLVALHCRISFMEKRITFSESQRGPKNCRYPSNAKSSVSHSS